MEKGRRGAIVVRSPSRAWRRRVVLGRVALVRLEECIEEY
jgi:hypothetical protein